MVAMWEQPCESVVKELMKEFGDVAAVWNATVRKTLI